MTPHTFHQSLIRPNLLLGCDRDLILFSGLMAFILIAMSQSWTATSVTGDTVRTMLPARRPSG